MEIDFLFLPKDNNNNNNNNNNNSASCLSTFFVKSLKTQRRLFTVAVSFVTYCSVVFVENTVRFIGVGFINAFEAINLAFLTLSRLLRRLSCLHANNVCEPIYCSIAYFRYEVNSPLLPDDWHWTWFQSETETKCRQTYNRLIRFRLPFMAFRTATKLPTLFLLIYSILNATTSYFLILHSLPVFLCQFNNFHSIARFLCKFRKKVIIAVYAQCW